MSKTEEFCDRSTDILPKVAARGVNVFDQNYRLIPGSNPKRYETVYDHACELELQTYFFLKSNTGIIYCLAFNSNGYAPAHNSKYSQAPTGDYDRDLRFCRYKRIFDDPVGIKLVKNRERSLFRTCLQLAILVINDLSMPILINGKHWGAVRIDFRSDMLAGKAG